MAFTEDLSPAAPIFMEALTGLFIPVAWVNTLVNSSHTEAGLTFDCAEQLDGVLKGSEFDHNIHPHVAMTIATLVPPVTLLSSKAHSAVRISTNVLCIHHSIHSNRSSIYLQIYFMMSGGSL